MEKIINSKLNSQQNSVGGQKHIYWKPNLFEKPSQGVSGWKSLHLKVHVPNIDHGSDIKNELGHSEGLETFPPPRCTNRADAHPQHDSHSSSITSASS